VNVFQVLIPIVLAGSLCSGFAQTSSPQPAAVTPFPHYADKARGWFFREVTPEPEVPRVETPPPAPAPPPSPAAPAASAPLQPLSVAWLRQKLPLAEEIAVNKPTPENIRYYLYLQKMALDAADRFSAQVGRASLNDLVLDENAARPIWGRGADVMQAQADRGRSVLLRKIAKTHGIWFFFGADCMPCRAQAPIIQMLVSTSGFAVMPISMDGRNLPNSPFKRVYRDSGQAERLGVEGTPTIFLVSPPDKFVPIASSLVAMDEIENRIIELALSSGDVTQEEYQSTKADRKSLFPSPGDMPQIPDAIADDPVALVQYLRAKAPPRPVNH
jgi:conjugal transfer pilus assembly protein TraF